MLHIKIMKIDEEKFVKALKQNRKIKKSQTGF
jgi:hypothetical protein